MRFLGIFAVCFLLFSSSEIQAQDLTNYQWKNRIILLKDTDLDSDWLQAQLKRLQSNSKELLEREVVLFLLSDNFVYDEKRLKTNLQADTIISQYGLSSFEGLVLVGKDGGIKLQEEFIVNPTIIIELIDSMPMRMSEMKN